jgi:hypothetical protein
MVTIVWVVQYNLGLSLLPSLHIHSKPPPEIPKFCESLAEFPVPWNIHP